MEHGLARVHQRMLALLPAPRRARLTGPVTIDLDSTDVEVYGRKKRGVADNYLGQRCGRPQLASWASPDLLREMVEALVAALMSAEADAVCNAPYGVVSEERVNTRNGYRHRDFDTRVGTLDVAIPKLRTGSYFPDSENLRGGWLVASDPFPD